jgi:hypothetical protein
MMRRLVVCAALFSLGLVGPVPARGDGAPNARVLGTCQDLIRKAVRRFTGDLQRHVGRCASHGLDCLLRNQSATCCPRAARHCNDDRRKIAADQHRFTVHVVERACSQVPFDALVGPTGLDFSAAIAACRCLAPPVEVVDLDTLSECLLRVTARDTVDLLIGSEMPRAREALACMGREDDFPGVSEPPSAAEGCAASPTPSATATAGGSATPVPSATAASSATATVAATPAGTATPGSTSTAGTTATVRATATGTPAPTFTAAATSTPGATGTLAATFTPPAIATKTRTPTPVVTATRSRTPTPVPSTTPVVVPVCGNGVVEGDEECDGQAIDNTFCAEDICTCEDFCDDVGGTLSCNRNCTLNFSACTAGGCEF